MSTVDWDKEDQSTGEYQVYPAGVYMVKINNWERVTASTGTKQIRFKGEIMEPEDFKGSRITDHAPLTEKSMWRVAKLVKGCGIDIKGLGKMDINSAAFANVLNMIKGRLTLWSLEVDKTPKGADRNSVVDNVCPVDQPILSASDLISEEVPDFLKDGA